MVTHWMLLDSEESWQDGYNYLKYHCAKHARRYRLGAGHPIVERCACFPPGGYVDG